MRAESMVVDALPARQNMTPKRYLRAMLAVARSARRKEYAVVYLSTGTFFRTDRLGALAVGAMVDGRSDAEAMERVEQIEVGAGERARRLIDVLDAWSATTRMPPLQAGRRWRLRRRLTAQAVGLALSVLGQLVLLAPTAILAWIFRILHSTPLVHHVWRSSRFTILDNLRASGYASRPDPWLLEIGRRCAAEPSRNYLFMYLGTVLSPERLARLVDRLFDRDAADDLAGGLQAAGATVGVFLHSPLCVAVPNALRNRGLEVVRSVVPKTHGINVSESSGPLSYFFGDAPNIAVDASDPSASGALLRHLKAGRCIYVSLDEPARERKPVAEIEMLGDRFPRNDGPAWLAVRSGRPLALWTTFSSTSGVVIKASPLLHPDPSLPVERRVAALSERLYACADAAIREYPEAWSCWSYLSLIKGHRR